MAPPLGSNLLVRLPTEMHDQLRSEAARRGRSASELVREAIAEILEPENEESALVGKPGAFDQSTKPAKRGDAI